MIALDDQNDSRFDPAGFRRGSRTLRRIAGKPGRHISGATHGGRAPWYEAARGQRLCPVRK